MQAGGVAHPAVDYTNIVTRYDELVTPYTSGLMPPGPNVANHVVQDHCELDLADHLAVAADPVTATLILNALAPNHQRPIPCQLVLPAIGAPLATPPAPLDSDGDALPDYGDQCPTVDSPAGNCPPPVRAVARSRGRSHPLPRGAGSGPPRAPPAASRPASAAGSAARRRREAKRRCARRR